MMVMIASHSVDLESSFFFFPLFSVLLFWVSKVKKEKGKKKKRSKMKGSKSTYAITKPNDNDNDN